jgi:hypothetical protein
MEMGGTGLPWRSRPLPAELARGEFGTGWYYERFSPFGWSWVWRRSLLFGAIAIPCGALLGVVHGLYAQSWPEGIAIGWRSAGAMLLLVVLGPSLAALVRRQHWPLSAERTAVVAAVVIGILVSWALRIAVETHHDHLMGTMPAKAQRLINLFSGGRPLHFMVERISDILTVLVVHAIGGGALALRSYFGEPRRLQEYAARRELDTLRQQKLAAEARLSVLQAQVEPHFLFNTLASVSAEIEADPRHARELIHALALYLRSTLPRLRREGPAVVSTLEEQFELCRRYLDVMALRLGGRLAIDIDLAASLGPLPFPPLLLLSLVENAITHGVEPKAGPVRVELSARRTEVAGRPMLEVLVRDDGVGLREGLAEGTGISNVRAQLATLYGPAARVSVESPQTGGVRATIAIPLQP